MATKLVDRAEETAKWNDLKGKMNGLMSQTDDAIKSARKIEWPQFSDAIKAIEAGIQEMMKAIGEK